MTELKVSKIAEIVGGKLHGNGDISVSSVCTDSRKTQISDLFVALRGEKFDGNDFLPDVDGRVGAALCEREAEVSYPTIVVDASYLMFSSFSTSLRLMVSMRVTPCSCMVTPYSTSASSMVPRR